MVDSAAMPSLLTVSLKVYLTPASSSEPEIPSTGPLEPRPKFRLEQSPGPWEEEEVNECWSPGQGWKTYGYTLQSDHNV